MTNAHHHCIYHHRPAQMMGTMLHPLNDLKTLAPEVYQLEMAKYSDHPARQKLPKMWLPELGCRWNDVIHCSSVHPHLLYEEWLRHLDRVNPDLHFFEIPIGTVAHLPLAIMCPAGGGDSRDISLIAADQYTEIAEVPGATRDWYATLAGRGRFGAHFVGVPHILVRGPIETRGLRELRWSDPIPDQ